MKQTQLLLTFITILITKTTFGCSCGSSLPIDTLFKRSSVIFEGILIEETSLSDLYTSYGYPIEITNFKITENIKGVRNLGDTISILKLGSDCDETFSEKGKYIIYGFSIGLRLNSTNICFENSFETSVNFESDLKRLKYLRDNCKGINSSDSNMISLPNYIMIEDTTLINLKRLYNDYSILIKENEKQNLRNKMLIGIIVILSIFLIINKFRK